MATVNGTIAAGAYGDAAKPKQKLSFIIAASSCGTLIEWYDFYLYGVLATFFADQFFPGDMRNGFLFSLGIFWTGFIVRPFGRDPVRTSGRSDRAQIHLHADARPDGAGHVPGRMPADL